MTRPQQAEKSFTIRMLELVRALQLISDSLKHLRQGEHWHLVTLSGQLRALLTERSRQADPLLMYIAQSLQKTLKIYCMQDVNDPSFPESLRDKRQLHVAGFPLTVERQFPAQFELNFSELLDLEIILFKGNRYSVRTLIEWYANKTGGAHYSKQIPKDFASLLAINFFNIQPIANVLIQLGEATLTVGRNLLKSVVDLEFHALVVIPPQDAQNSTNSNILFDSRYEGSSMQLTLSLNQRLMPSLAVVGLQGVGARVESDRLIDWSKPRHLFATLTIQDNLSTRIELAVDGVSVGRTEVKEPLFVLSDPLDYDMFHNRAVEGSTQQFSFGVCQVLMIGREVSYLDRANLMIYMNKQQKETDISLILYTSGSYGHSARGTKNLTMTGNVKHLKLSEIHFGS
ncbi:MAG: hypothetical protein AAGF01_28270 [Cyanobacteria bacterium P01_G01_bin.38]